MVEAKRFEAHAHKKGRIIGYSFYCFGLGWENIHYIVNCDWDVCHDIKEETFDPMETNESSESGPEMPIITQVSSLSQEINEPGLENLEKFALSQVEVNEPVIDNLKVSTSNQAEVNEPEAEISNSTPYECPICQNKYSFRVDAEEHIENYHKIPKETQAELGLKICNT